MKQPTVMKNKTISSKKGSTIPNEGKKGAMMQRQYTGQQKPGVSSQEQTRSSDKGAKGGSTKMAGFTGSKKQKPA